MKKFFTFATFLFAVAAFSQVGVNTNNPQGTFHVDGAKDNSLTGVPTPTQQANDLLITSAGNVGIGTITPNAKLDVRTNPTSTGDPGNGHLGVGTTSKTAPAAGAVRYSTSTGGSLEYSNGIVWNRLESSSTTISFTFKLNAGETVRPRIYNSGMTTAELRMGATKNQCGGICKFFSS